MKQTTKKIGAGTLALVLSAVSMSANLMPVYAVQEQLSETIVDDISTSFVYSEGNGNNGGWGVSGAGGTHDVTEHWSNSVGAWAEFTFTGTELEFHGVKAPNHRMITVSIDGGDAVSADCYAASRTDGTQLLFSSADSGIELEEGEHTAVLTVSEDTNEAATGSTKGISLTYAVVRSENEPETPEEPDEEFPGYTIVEDMMTTTSDEPFKIHYNGTWNGGTYYPNLFHDGYEHYAYNGDSYDITFMGTGVEIWASKNAAHGIYDVTIDGEDAGTADASTTGSTVHQQLIYSKTDLEDGEHTMRVALNDQEGKAIQLDYLKIYHSPIAPTGVTLDQSELTMMPGASATLTATVTPWVASTKKITWSSSDESVATVKDGVVTAADDLTEKKTCTITATAADASATVVVTVDPLRSVMNVYAGNEKMLDLSADYATLKDGNGSAIEKTLWKGDRGNAKLVVSSLGRELSGVTVETSDLTDGKGHVLAAENITPAWLEEVTAGIGRGNSSAPRKSFPEKITDNSPVSLSGEETRFSWITIDVPADQEAGTYTGSLKVKSDQSDQEFEVAVRVTVANQTLPENDNTEMQLWQHPFSVANYYLGLGSSTNAESGVCNQLDEDFYFTDDFFDTMRASTIAYAEAGGRDVVANIVEEAWNHQSFYNDPSMIKWTMNEDGKLTFDYTWYDAWINFMIECGVLNPETGEGAIKCYSIVPWNNQVTWKDANGNTVKKSLSVGSDEWKEIWGEFLVDFMAHSEEMGWFDITYISMDERGIDMLRPTVELIKSTRDDQGRSLKISSALNYKSPDTYDLTDQIEDISINQGYSTNTSEMKALTAHRKALGLKTTIYTCTGDFPGNFMISDPGDNYWSVLNATRLGGDGYMKWAYDNYLYNMSDNATYRYWEPGDGWFIYPEERDSWTRGEEASFYSTPRYEMLKQGIRDANKIKALMADEDLSEAWKDKLQKTLDSMSLPNSTTSYGSRTYASQEVRLAYHSQMNAVEDVIAETSLAAGQDAETSEELNKLINSLQARTLKVSMGADATMKAKVILDDLKTQIDDPDVYTTVRESGNQWEVTLEADGAKAVRLMNFDLKEKDTLTIATYNIYGWGYPSMSNISNMLKSVDADVVGLQECNHNVNGGGQDEQLVNAGEYPYSAFYGGYDSPTVWGGSAMVSRYPLSDVGGKVYDTNDDTNRAYVRSVIHVGDKEVALYNTHIVWLRDPDEYQAAKAAQIRELIEAVNADPTPYKIITGDMNSDIDISELDPLLLNFNDANGWNGTWFETGEMDSSMKINYLDHILTTTNMEIVDVDMLEGEPSDHNILYANIRFKDEDDFSIPRQLYDNTMTQARELSVETDVYTAESIAVLEEAIRDVQSKPLTKENQYDLVLQLRDAMAQLKKQPTPLKPEVVYYDFKDGSLDDVMGNYPGSGINNPTFETGFVGQGLSMGSGKGLVTVDPSLKVGKEDFSVSFWMRIDEEKNDTVFFGNKTGDSGSNHGIFLCNYEGLYANAGTVSARYDTDLGGRNHDVLNGKWHMVTAVYDRDYAISLYVDGELKAEGKSFANIKNLSLDTDYPFTLGAGTTGKYAQGGVLDEFKMFNYALDGDQVGQLYQNYADQLEAARTALNEAIAKASALMHSDDFAKLDADLQEEIRTAANGAAEALSATAPSVAIYENAASALNTALDKVDLPEPVGANKMLLNEAIAYARNIDDADFENLNVVVKKEFDAALAEAIAVSEDDSADQETVDAAWRRLTRAIHMLQFISDKSELNILIAQAKVIEAELDLYDEDGKAAFVEALNHAREIAASDTALNDSINEAAAALQEAMNGLHKTEKQIDTSLLAWLVSTVDGAAQADYTPSTWTAFAAELEKAKGVLADPESQDEVDAELASLNAAYMALRLKPSEDLIQSLNQFTVMTASLNFALFSADQIDLINAVQNEVTEALNNPDLTLDEAKTLVDKTETVKAMIEDVQNANKPADSEETKKPEESVKPADSEADKKVEASADQKTSASTNKSVKTASATGFGAMAASMLAALGLADSLRRKRK